MCVVKGSDLYKYILVGQQYFIYHYNCLSIQSPTDV